MGKTLSPLKAIRQYCLGCSENFKEVRLCPITKCELHPYRFGKSPNRQGTRKGNAEHLKAWREKKDKKEGKVDAK